MTTTTTTPPPQPTPYRGVWFRSASEAAFARAFDRAGLPWQYEAWLVTFPGWMQYLPDFWLPTVACWVEVKGPGDERLWKSEALAAAGLDPVLVGRVGGFTPHDTVTVSVSPVAPVTARPAAFTSDAWQNASQGVPWPRERRGYLA